MKIDPLGFTVREATAADRNFILSCWHESVAGWMYPRGKISERAHIKKRIRNGTLRLLATRPAVVACDTDDPTHLFGFACGQPDPPTLHYVYVKPVYRRCGLARALVAAVCGQPKSLACTHWGWGLPRDEKDALEVDGVRLVYMGLLEPPSSRDFVDPKGFVYGQSAQNNPAL